jgi:tRNA(Arg) A34 adenosine deaminase TadA
MSKAVIDKFMRLAIDLSVENVANGGGPFGAVIARSDELIATGVNNVTRQNDPTAHAEVCAIREACKRLGTFDLSGCTIYSSCEPCPMCLSAIYWARIDRLYYGNTKADADAIGFSDDFIYKELELKPEERSVLAVNTHRQEALAAFRAWAEKSDKTPY